MLQYNCINVINKEAVFIIDNENKFDLEEFNKERKQIELTISSLMSDFCTKYPSFDFALCEDTITKNISGNIIVEYKILAEIKD